MMLKMISKTRSSLNAVNSFKLFYTSAYDTEGMPKTRGKSNAQGRSQHKLEAIADV